MAAQMGAAMASSPSRFASPWLFGFATALKLLLIPSYRSTDFDVHRHWLALTHSLPADQWYTDTSSQWTLDYPPFFAHFSYLLSLPSTLFDGSLISISHFTPSAQSVIFMRLTVIAADIMLLIAVSLMRSSGDGDGSSRNRTIAAALTFLSPALLIVDHVHFQYNGFLLGLMMISLALLEKGRDLSAGVVFAALLCFNHIFLVAAPVYFVYLLRHFCFRSKLDVWKGVIRTAVMGLSVITLFIAAFGPFLFYGQMLQVLSQIFQFGRGLCHAYWAPNFWVFYIVVDKALGLV